MVILQAMWVAALVAGTKFVFDLQIKCLHGFPPNFHDVFCPSEIQVD